MKKHYLVLLFIFILSSKLIAQVNVKDSSIYTPMLGFSYGYYLPRGDMAKRFGNNSSVNLNIDFKTIHYWTLGMNGSYFFGSNIKVGLFDSIASPGGYIINKGGEFSDIRLWERGFTISGTLGRMIPFTKPNPNSGIMINIGLGFMQHKIRI